VLTKQASKCCLESCDYAWLILVKNRFKNRSSREEDSRINNSPGISSSRVFAVTSYFATRCPVDLTRIVVCFCFYFFRFLLICQRVSLNLTYILKWFFFLEKFQNTNSEQGVLGVLYPNCTKRFSTIFSLIFGPTFRKILSKIFCKLLGPRRLVLALKNLGRIASLFLENFTLQLTNPVFLSFISEFCG